MGTSAGPSLAGIGRGGDSNLVLEMDAHDAKSYPGEPTTNTIINGYFPGTDTTTVPTGWALHYSASKIGFRPAGEDFFYKNLGLSNPRVYKCNGGGWYSDTGTGFIGIVMPQPTPGFSTSTATTVSFWYRFTGENAAQLSNQTIFFDFDYGLANLTKINYTDYNDTEWHFYSETLTSSGSYAYYNLYIYAGSLYSVCPGGSYFEIGAVQVEQKGYATPFVGDGQFARPASTNLMIHASSSNAGVNAFGVNGGQSGWTGWTLAGGAATSTDYTYNGPTSIKCVSLSQTMQSPTFSTVSGKSYRVSYWTYCSTDTTGGAGNEHSELYVYDGNGTSAVYNPTWALAPLGSWIHVTRTFTSSVTGSSAYMKIHPDDNETIYFADVVVEDADQIIMDSSPSKHTVTVNGDVTHSSAQSKFSGGSVYFDGSDSLSMPDSADWNIGSADFTMDAWAYFDGFAVTLHNQSTVNATSNSAFIIWVGSSPNTAGIYLSDITGWDYYNVNSTSLSTGQWYHLAAVRSGDSLRMYVNGVSTSATSLPSAWTVGDSSRVLQIGEQDGNNYMNGYLDEVRITKGTALWTADFTPPTRRNLSAPVVDRSSHDNGGNFATTDPTDVVTYRVGEVIRPIANAYWNFDGTDDSISLGGTTAAASDRPLNAYPFTFTAWVTSDNGWVSPSGMNELLNMNIAGQRVSLGSTVYSGWPTGPAIMYGGTSHWTCPSSAFGNPTGWTHIAFVIYGSNNSNHKIYINGVSQALTDNGLAHGGTAGWTLGSNSVSAEHWVGNIANAQLYNKTLTEAEVIENFNQQSSRFNVPNWSNRDIVKDGLVVWLDAGESESYSGSGSTWYDISGNGNNATLSGLTFNSGSGGYFKPTTGTSGSATTPDLANTATMTMECWYKSSSGDSFTTYGRIMDRGDTTISIGTYNTYQLRSWVYAGGGRTTPENIKDGIGNDGLWHHIGYTFDGSTARFYFDGVYVDSGSRSGALESPYALVLFAGDGYGFGGQIAVARYYSTVLSASEIEQNFIVQKQRFGV